MSTRNDELDTLTDAALSEAFAVEVAEWRKITWRRRQIWDAHGIPYTKPDFATSADSVLPFLEKGVSWHSAFHAGAGYMVTHSSQCGQYIGECDAAPRVTFARAACLALIRAKRSEKGQP